MKILKKLLFYYSLGIAISLLFIGFIHLYSYIAEPYFSYAQWNNIMITALISGFPFGIALWIFKNLKMTEAQKTTAKQIVKEYEDLYYEKPIRVDMGDRIIHLQRNGPILHPHYKILHNDNILFGVGTEYTSYGMFVIGINSWKIIKPNGELLDKSCYSDLELELAQQSVELSGFSSRDDLIGF